MALKNRKNLIKNSRILLGGTLEGEPVGIQATPLKVVMELGLPNPEEVSKVSIEQQKAMKLKLRKEQLESFSKNIVGLDNQSGAGHRLRSKRIHKRRSNRKKLSSSVRKVTRRRRKQMRRRR